MPASVLRSLTRWRPDLTHIATSSSGMETAGENVSGGDLSRRRVRETPKTHADDAGRRPRSASDRPSRNGSDARPRLGRINCRAAVPIHCSSCRWVAEFSPPHSGDALGPSDGHAARRRRQVKRGGLGSRDGWARVEKKGAALGRRPNRRPNKCAFKLCASSEMTRREEAARAVDDWQAVDQGLRPRFPFADEIVWARSAVSRERHEVRRPVEAHFSLKRQEMHRARWLKPTSIVEPSARAVRARRRQPCSARAAPQHLGTLVAAAPSW
jgi:hypothetical protein